MRVRLRFMLIACIALVLQPGSVLAGEDAVMTVEHPWARATILKSRPAAVYLTLRNRGTKADRLLKVSSPVAETIAIHSTTMSDGVMKMSTQETLEIGPHSSIPA